MRRCRRLSAVLVLTCLGLPIGAQLRAESPDAVPLASGHLASLVELPTFFRLYRVHLPASQHASYRGASAMLYGLAGAAAMEPEGDAAQRLAAGAGAFVRAGQGVTINAGAAEPTELLLFVVTARPNQKPPFDRPAIVKEVFRTGDPLPGLKAGPYDFTLVRLTLPAGMPADPPHYRTGAALSYVLAGSGSLIADGKAEKMPAGTAQVAPAGWFHQWANPGDTPLIIVQANISQEGAAAVVPEAAK